MPGQEVILTIYISEEGNTFTANDLSENSYEPQVRNNHDNILNGHGKRLLETCRTQNHRIAIVLVLTFEDNRFSRPHNWHCLEQISVGRRKSFM